VPPLPTRTSPSIHARLSTRKSMSRDTKDLIFAAISLVGWSTVAIIIVRTFNG